MDPHHPLPAGFSTRVPTVDDADAIAELVNEVTIAEAGVPWKTVEEVRDHLGSPGRDPAAPDVLLVDDRGGVAGYVQTSASEDGVAVLVLVRSRLWGLGLSTWLVGHAEAWAAETARASGTRVVLRLSRFLGNDAAERLFRVLGYTHARTFWIMRIDLAAHPTAVVEPAGIRIRAFDPRSDVEAVYAALREAFDDHWGGGFDPIERWRHATIDGEGAAFDPDLWFVAADDDEIVGAVCSSATTPRVEDTGEVAYLGVRRTWRRRGIGVALLMAAFEALRRRGVGNCELSVDAESLTGATRLYERAGMRVVYGWDVWEKSIPSGDARSSEHMEAAMVQPIRRGTAPSRRT